MKKTKVLLLIHKLIQGGAEQQLFELAKGIDRQKFEVTVGCFVPGGAKWEEFSNLTGVRLVCFRRSHKFDFLVLKRIISFLRRNAIDVIHAYLPPATFLGILAGLIVRTPVLIIGERGTETSFATIGSRAYFLLENLVTRFVDLVLANSIAGKEWRLSLGARPNQIAVLHNGLNPERLETTARQLDFDLDLREDSVVLGNVSRLVPMKDHPTLFRAIALIREEYPNIRCLLIGDGPLRKELEKAAELMHLEKVVVFLGQQDNVGDFIRLFDVAVLSSKHTEGCSNFLLEAMYCGKPVVATDVGGSRELVVDGVTGFLVPREEPQALAAAILNLLKSAELRAKLGKAGRQRVEQEFMVDRMIRETERIYHSLMATKTRRDPDSGRFVSSAVGWK